MSVEFVLPTSARVEVKSYRLSLDTAKRPLHIGLLANGFPDGDKFLQRQADAIREIIPDATFRLETKGNTDQLSSCVKDPLLSDMAGEVDGVIIGWAHCGSCTSGVTRDAIAFAEKGVPSVTLVCDIFWDYATWIGNALGMDDLPRVKLPYPVSGTADDNQDSVARRVAPQILAGFAGGHA